MLSCEGNAEVEGDHVHKIRGKTIPDRRRDAGTVRIEPLAKTIEKKQTVDNRWVLHTMGVLNQYSNGPLSTGHQLEDEKVQHYHENYQYDRVNQALQQIPAKTHAADTLEPESLL
jgi:hypothetical protein